MPLGFSEVASFVDVRRGEFNISSICSDLEAANI